MIVKKSCGQGRPGGSACANPNIWIYLHVFWQHVVGRPLPALRLWEVEGTKIQLEVGEQQLAFSGAEYTWEVSNGRDIHLTNDTVMSHKKLFAKSQKENWMHFSSLKTHRLSRRTTAASRTCGLPRTRQPSWRPSPASSSSASSSASSAAAWTSGTKTSTRSLTKERKMRQRREKRKEEGIRLWKLWWRTLLTMKLSDSHLRRVFDRWQLCAKMHSSSNLFWRNSGKFRFPEMKNVWVRCFWSPHWQLSQRIRIKQFPPTPAPQSAFNHPIMQEILQNCSPKAKRKARNKTQPHSRIKPQKSCFSPTPPLPSRLQLICASWPSEFIDEKRMKLHLWSRN